MNRGDKIAVVGSGISGLSAAWLLSKTYDVTLFEQDHRAGGHSNTVDVPSLAGPVPVDTGFIVYNDGSYPNLVALFRHLDVATCDAGMSFAVSLDDGRYEYSGSGLNGLFGQRRNLINLSHYRMTSDILRFFREAPNLLADAGDEHVPLGDYLSANGYSSAFVDRHILPMAAAIWSTPSARVMQYPVRSFVRFFANHGLLQARNQPAWQTVVGGSRSYVTRMLADFRGVLETGAAVDGIIRRPEGVDILRAGQRQTFDACVVATHADQALALLQDADTDEVAKLGAFRYAANRAVLHRDPALMPRRRRIWSSWNYLGRQAPTTDAAPALPELSVTYWMNNLQPLGQAAGDLFVTLNPTRTIADDQCFASFDYAHPILDGAAAVAQRGLWSLQGRRRTWFCGSYFGYGFHEDGLQSGLAAAEDIGGVRRPWTVADESGRIHLTDEARRLRPVEAEMAP